MKETRPTYCRICEVACGLAVTVEDGHITKIEPDRENPYSWRDFCIKGAKAHDVAYHPRRITAPLKRVGDRYVAATYEEAVDDIAARLKNIIAEHGPEAVGMYAGNPQGFSFDGLIFQTALLKAIGTHNWFWVNSVDANAIHAVSELMYGSPYIIPGIDVDPCKCFLLIGANPAESTNGWAGHVPGGWKRILAAQKKGADLIVVDPRFTPTAAKANLHLPVKPGEDWAFLLGVIKTVIDNGWLHPEDCARTRGLDVLQTLSRDVSLTELSRRCEVTVAQIKDVARRFATAPAAHCVIRTGAGQSRNGGLAEWLSNVLNVITGRLDRPGGRVHNRGVFDLLSMPGPSKTPSRVRGWPPVAGAHALAELPDEINTPGPGRIRTLIIHAGNPVVSGPDGKALDAALASLELLVSVDLFQRESHRHAHWLIPGVHFLERTDVNPLLVPVHDEPFIQMGQAVIDRPAGVRPEWEFFVDLALKMDLPLFGSPAVNRLIRATRWLAKITGNTKVAFDPIWMAWMMIRQGKKAKWRDIVNNPHGIFFDTKRYGGIWKDMRTPDKKVDLAPEPLIAQLKRRLSEKVETSPAGFPLQMITRRRVQTMNSWLSDTTGRLIKPFSGNTVEINVVDAQSLGISDGEPVRLVSRTASIETRALVSDRIRPGVVVCEHGWGSRLFDPVGQEKPECHGINRNLLVANDEVDPISFVPSLNGTHVRLEPLAASSVQASLLEA